MVPEVPKVPGFGFRGFRRSVPAGSVLVGSVFAWALVLIGGTGLRVNAQKLSGAELASRITGSWTINLTLSPSFKPSGRSGPGRAGGGVPRGAAYAVSGIA